VLTSLTALTGWKAIGALSLLFGVTAPTVHAFFEFVERRGRGRRAGGEADQALKTLAGAGT
jgi:hypothetical protein